MKKTGKIMIPIILCTLFAFFLMSCGKENEESTDKTQSGDEPVFLLEDIQNNDSKGIILEVTKSTGKGANICLKNTADRTVTYGEDFFLLKRVGDKIETIPGTYATISIGYTLVKGSEENMEINWEDELGTLAPGTYILSKKFYFTSDENVEQFKAYTEFTIE